MTPIATCRGEPVAIHTDRIERMGRAANEPTTLRRYWVRIEAHGLLLEFDAMSEDSTACSIQHMGLAEQMGGKLSVRSA